MFNQGLLMAIEMFVVLFLAIFIRLVPHYLTPHGSGVDNWFWKAYIEKYRRDGNFPPMLQQFILDKDQWYPPIFPLLMARLPRIIFDHYNYLIAIVIDMLRMLFVMGSVFCITEGRVAPTLVAGTVYAVTPILISYNSQMNPRGLGALFLDIVIVLVLLLVWHAAPLWLWILAAIFSGLILLTHKMTTQLFWFLCLAFWALSGNWRILLLIPVSIIMALMLSKGFYIKVLRAHWDIVTFWNRNWRWLSAHPILESPIYGVPGYETPTKYYRSGLIGLCRRALYLIGFNPWAWSLLVAFFWMHMSGGYLRPEALWIIRWIEAILLFAVATTFISAMRCLGHGYLYTYNSSFPAALASGIIWGSAKHDVFVSIILLFTLFICVVVIAFYIQTLLKSKTLKVDSFMNNALERLRLLPEGVVICFPQHWHDVAAYKSGKHVLFGGHGYGYKLLEFIFPRLKVPISGVIRKHNVKYLFTYEGYLPKNFISDLPCADIEEFGQYRLYRFKYAN